MTHNTLILCCDKLKQPLNFPDLNEEGPLCNMTCDKCIRSLIIPSLLSSTETITETAPYIA